MSEVAFIFGIVTLTLLVWGFWHETTRLMAAGILFAQWGLSIGSQTLLNVETPIDVYWAADFASAILFWGIFLKYGGQWLYWIGVLFVGMMGAHVLYAGGLHEYYHYWLITPMFAVQILIVLARMVLDVAKNHHIHNSSGGVSSSGGTGS